MGARLPHRHRCRRMRLPRKSPKAPRCCVPIPGKEARPPCVCRGCIDLADVKGKVVLVNFWATWCPPCVEEIPSLQKLYRQLKPRGLGILAVDVGESVQTTEEFLADKPIAFPVLMDVEGEALRRSGIYAFPTTLVLDRDHRVRYAVCGAFDWSSQEVIDTLSPLLVSDGRRPKP